MRIVTIAAVAALGLTLMACENKAEKAQEATAESAAAANQAAAASQAALEALQQLAGEAAH